MTNTPPPVIRSFSQSTRDKRCLEVWFAKEVTDGGREWLLEAINEKAQRDCSGWSTEELMVPNLGWGRTLNEKAGEQAADNPRDIFADRTRDLQK